MSFMQLQITDKQHGFTWEDNEGVHYLPGSEFAINDVYSLYDLSDDVEVTETPLGYFGRYSAPGYMDCTDWSFDTNKRRLIKDLKDMYE